MLGDVEVATVTAIFLHKVQHTPNKPQLTTAEIGIIISVLALVIIAVTVGGMIILRRNRHQSLTSG